MNYFHENQVIDNQKVFQLIQSINCFPNDQAYYPAMIKLIETARRVGQLDIIPPVLERAEKYSPRTVLDSGYHYCKGLYQWFTGFCLNLLSFLNFSIVSIKR